MGNKIICYEIMRNKIHSKNQIRLDTLAKNLLINECPNQLRCVQDEVLYIDDTSSSMVNLICTVVTQQFPRNCHQRSTPGWPIDPVIDCSPHNDQLRRRPWGSSAILFHVTQHPAAAFPLPLHPIRYIALNTCGCRILGADTRFSYGCGYRHILSRVELHGTSVRFGGIAATWWPLATFYAWQIGSHLKIRIP